MDLRLHNAAAFSLPLATAILVVACSKEEGRCHAIPAKISKLDFQVFDVPRRSPASTELISAQARLEACFRYGGGVEPGYTFRLEEIRGHTNADSLLIYEFIGIDDYRAAYRVNPAGIVTAVYEFGMND